MYKARLLFLQDNTEPVQVIVIIFFCVETSFAVMPALHDVQRDFIQMSAGATGMAHVSKNNLNLAPLILRRDDLPERWAEVVLAVF